MEGIYCTMSTQFIVGIFYMYSFFSIQHSCPLSLRLGGGFWWLYEKKKYWNYSLLGKLELFSGSGESVIPAGMRIVD